MGIHGSRNNSSGSSGLSDEHEFDYAISLDHTSDLDRLSASLQDGVLSLTAPKKEPPTPKRIAIQVTTNTKSTLPSSTVAIANDTKRNSEKNLGENPTPTPTNPVANKKLRVDISQKDTESTPNKKASTKEHTMDAVPASTELATANKPRADDNQKKTGSSCKQS